VAQEPAATEGKLLHPSFAKRQLLSMAMQTMLLRRPFENSPEDKFTKLKHTAMNHVICQSKKITRYEIR